MQGFFTEICFDFNLDLTEQDKTKGREIMLQTMILQRDFLQPSLLTQKLVLRSLHKPSMNTWRGGEKIYFEQVISDGLTDHKSTRQHFSRTLTIFHDVIQITGIEIKIAPVCHHICKSTTVHQSSELIIFNPLY